MLQVSELCLLSMASEGKRLHDLSVEQGDSEEGDELGEPVLPPRKPRIRTGPGIIPLLETISTIEDLCDSDESSELGEATSCSGNRLKKQTKNSQYEATEYSGSSSIDSGYKSSACPTPDLVDGYYGHKKQAAGGRLNPPRPPAAPLDSCSANKDLDHLISLRQTLIKAIRRYETEKEQQSKVHQDALMTGTSIKSPAAGATLPHSLPRITDYGVVSVLNTASVNKRTVRLASDSSETDNRAKPVWSAAASTVKDGSASSMHDNQIAMLEEEIDFLLHGQIDDASQTNHATQRLISQSGEENQTTTTRFSRVARCMLEIIEDLQRQHQSAPQPCQQQQCPQLRRCVAPQLPPKPSRCSRQQTTASRKAAAAAPPPTQAVSSTEESSPRESEHEYHVYEEIVYDVSESSAKAQRPHKTVPPPPPPLPARPFKAAEAPLKSVPKFMHPKKQSSTWLRSLRKEKSSVGQWWKCGSGTALERPNVRANLYTFSSAPLPRERVLPSEDKREHHADEEYGFRIVSH